jgi:hypothetical protein
MVEGPGQDGTEGCYVRSPVGGCSRHGRGDTPKVSRQSLGVHAGREIRCTRRLGTCTSDLFEQDDTTRAEVVLRTDAGTELRHVGRARRREGDRDVPEIGDELAVCRALSGLAHDLLDARIVDIQANDPTGAGPDVRLD